jgi:hypothetical protein
MWATRVGKPATDVGGWMNVDNLRLPSESFAWTKESLGDACTKASNRCRRMDERQ